MIPRSLKDHIGTKFENELTEIQVASGGSINEAYTFVVKGERYFLKYNSTRNFPNIILYEQEALVSIKKTGKVKVPEIIDYGQYNELEYLVLAYINHDPASNFFWESLGRQLADMHTMSGSSHFGWAHDNYLGSMPQHNQGCIDFSDFWITQRIQPQIKWAKDKKLLKKKDLQAFDRLFAQTHAIFPAAKPALVHGDLWNGNVIGNGQEGAFLIDPAIHYGHPESDIAFTYLFGGFHPVFYHAYFNGNPKQRGFEDRIDIYNLYPLLLHLNLFGSSYYSSIRSTLDRF